MELDKESKKVTRYYFIPTEDFVYPSSKKCEDEKELKKHIAKVVNEYYSQNMLTPKDIEMAKMARTVHINCWGGAHLESPWLIGRYSNTNIRSTKKGISLRRKANNRKVPKRGVINDARIN